MLGFSRLCEVSQQGGFPFAHQEHDDLRMMPAYHPGDGQPIFQWNGNVEQEYIGEKLFRFFQGIFTVLYFAADLPIARR